jgi:predicted enzyme related to lactoylglutathione lyase
MTRVTGIGGIFFKARDPAALQEWYRKHFGMDIQSWGGLAFDASSGVTAWSIFPETTKHFAPSTAPFMINYRVADLAALLEALRAEGCAVDDRMDDSEQGKFGWVMDPEGNRIELWEPPPDDLTRGGDAV